MNKKTVFSEIQQYIDLLHPLEKETFEKIKSTYIDINLDAEYYAILELYIELEKWNEFNSLMSKYVSEKKEEDISQNPHINYLYGRKELVGLNLLKAKNYLKHALKISKEENMNYIGVKTTLDLLQVTLFNYISQEDFDSLTEIKQLINELKLFIKDTIHHQDLPKLIQEIELHCGNLDINLEKLELRKIVHTIQELLRELVDLIRYSTYSREDFDSILPNQLIVLHRSGIPLKRYVKSEKIVDDILLFGGMVRAAKDIISEVFMGEVGKVMKIDYGEEIIILAEFGEKEAGIVLITKKDTFHQRRSLHESVKELNRIEIPQSFHGEISEKNVEKIDEIVTSWFGAGYLGE